jgi:predicted DNA repair protein MutK
VYGVVGLIVKMDDVGLSLAQRDAAGVAKLGRGMVQAMPKLLAVISVVGTAAMLWVGGHILLVGADDLGWTAPYDVVHHLEEVAHDAVSVGGGVLGWLANTAASAVVGLVVGAVVVVVVTLLLRLRKPAAAGAH